MLCRGDRAALGRGRLIAEKQDCSGTEAEVAKSLLRCSNPLRPSRRQRPSRPPGKDAPEPLIPSCVRKCVLASHKQHSDSVLLYYFYSLHFYFRKTRDIPVLEWRGGGRTERALVWEGSPRSDPSSGAPGVSLRQRVLRLTSYLCDFKRVSEHSAPLFPHLSAQATVVPDSGVLCRSNEITHGWCFAQCWAHKHLISDGLRAVVVSLEGGPPTVF